MPRKSRTLADALENRCAIVRSLGVLNDSWSFLLVREALLGRRTFAQFRESLGISSDILSARLSSLVEHGVLEKVAYQEVGQRGREAYELTAAGAQLKLVLVAMQQWGDSFVPQDREPSVVPVTNDGDLPVRAVLVDEQGAAVGADDVRLMRVDPSSELASRR